mgnify:CR=1 FL=1
MDTLNNWNNQESSDWDDDLETKINEMITKLNEIVTWINSQ